MESPTIKRYYLVSARVGLDGRQVMYNSMADDWDFGYAAFTYLSGMLADDHRIMAYAIILFSDDGIRYIQEEIDCRAKHLIDTRPLMDWVDLQEGINTVKPRPIAQFLEN